MDAGSVLVARSVHLLGLALPREVVAAQKENPVRNRRRGRPSLRERLASTHAYNSFCARAIDKEPPPLPDKLKQPQRVRVARPPDPDRPLEAAVNDAIWGAFKNDPRVKLYRNNRGVAVYGNKQVAYGVGPKGGSDWIGWRRVLITADMLGSFIAQFVALEAKRPGEKADDNQQRFIDQVKAAGGCAGVATSGEQALELIS